MDAKVPRTDFEWVSTDEPHASRRKAILDKYPEIKRLYGHDPNLKWAVTALVVVQILSLPLVVQLGWPTMVVVAYCFGGTINHSLLAAIHEISHNLAFGNTRPIANQWFGLFANLPIGFPASITFRKYHLDHHKYQGLETLDPDLPTSLEAKLFNTTTGKVVWLLLQPLFYVLRPALVRPKAIVPMELTNYVVQLFFNALVVQLCGWKAMWYLVLGSLLAAGLHPMAGHFISDHYVFKAGFETYSYYGVLNYITFNGGYHVEHHDFPAIPGSRLPQVRRIASEFYEHLPHHTSWTSVLYHFVLDPDIGPYARIKRKKTMKK